MKTQVQQELSQSELQGLRAVALGFNGSIFLAMGLGIFVVAALGQFTDLTNLLTTIGLVCLMVPMQIYLKRGWLRTTSWVMLIVLFAGVYLSMLRFGSISIAQASMACIPIIYCVIVLGTRAGMFLVAISILVSAAITWAKLSGKFTNASPTLPLAQWIILVVGFLIAFRIAYLIKQHLLDTSRSANLAQMELLQLREKSNNELMIALTELESQRYVIDQHAIVIKTDLNGNVTYGNRKFSEVTGYSPDEFVGKHIGMLRSGVHERGFFAGMVDTINAGGAWRAEVCIRAKDGSLLWLETTVAAFMNDEMRPREYIAVITDITQLRAAEQAANTANQAKSDFLANMSHEIRTPMNGVVGMVEVLKTTTMSSKQRDMVNTVHSSSLALLDILNDILDFSKIEAGKLEIETVTFPLRERLDEIVQLASGMASNQNVDFSYHVDAAVPELIRTDPTRLRQILFNLLSNALKFKADRADAQSLVSLLVEESSFDDGSPALEFRVSDNGIGMSDEVISHLFEAFTQADVSTARMYGGTGLGLSITRRLVEMLKGTLLVQSALQVGSIFTVLLPLNPSDRSQPLEIPDSKVPGPGSLINSVDEDVSILVVEDNSTNRDVILEQLKLLGYVADWAEDGEKGLAKWRSGHFNLVLTDCHMPNMDGFELTAAIRNEESANQHTHVVAITANALRGESQRCLDAGMDDYLSKPLRLKDLKEMLTRWQSGQARPDLTRPAQDFYGTSPSIETEPLVWDRHALQNALGDLNEQARTRMLQRFADHTGRQLLDLRHLCEQGDFQAVGALAHNVKTSARTVGAMQLGHLCDRLEMSCAEGDNAMARTKVIEILRAYEAIQIYLPEPTPAS